MEVPKLLRARLIHSRSYTELYYLLNE